MLSFLTSQAVKMVFTDLSVTRRVETVRTTHASRRPAVVCPDARQAGKDRSAMSVSCVSGGAEC